MVGKASKPHTATMIKETTAISQRRVSFGHVFAAVGPRNLPLKSFSAVVPFATMGAAQL